MTRFCAILAAAALLLTQRTLGQARAQTGVIPMRRLPQLSRALVPSGLAVDRGQIIIMDGYSDRLVFLDNSGRSTRSCGEIGAAPGQFYHPNGIAADLGKIAVLDAANGRLQLISAGCRVLAVIPVGEGEMYSRSVVMVGGRVGLNEPSSGWLIKMIDTSTGASVRLGRAAKAVDLYPGVPSLSQFNGAANYAWLAADASGNVYAAYTIAPVVSKFSRSGKLLFTVRLTGASVNRLVDNFLHRPPGDQGMLKSILGGVPADFVLKAIAVDPDTGDLLVLGGRNELFVLTPGGVLQSQLQLSFPGDRSLPVGATQMAVSRTHLYILALFAPGIYEGDLPRLGRPGAWGPSRERR